MCRDVVLGLPGTPNFYKMVQGTTIATEYAKFLKFVRRRPHMSKQVRKVTSVGGGGVNMHARHRNGRRCKKEIK